MFGNIICDEPHATITSDASGSWGCGAFSDTGAWFQFQWPKSWLDIPITPKELLPIVVTCAVWGEKGRTVRCLCDNAAVVAIIRSGSAKDAVIMHLMRCLFFFTAAHQLVLAPMHLPGRENAAADHLSRNALSLFLQLVASAEQMPAVLPEPLMQALVHHRPDWTSRAWRDSLRSTLPMGSPVLPRKPLRDLLQLQKALFPTSVSVSVVSVCITSS